MVFSPEGMGYQPEPDTESEEKAQAAEPTQSSQTEAGDTSDKKTEVKSPKTYEDVLDEEGGDPRSAAVRYRRKR